MKKETLHCDVCGEEVPGGLRIKASSVWVHFAAPNGFRFILDFVAIPPLTERVDADLCDRDRLRVLEAAVAQLKEET